MPKKNFESFSLPALLVISGQHRDPLVKALYQRMRNLLVENQTLRKPKHAKTHRGPGAKRKSNLIAA
jgi:hypothetical protein